MGYISLPDLPNPFASGSGAMGAGIAGFSPVGAVGGALMGIGQTAYGNRMQTRSAHEAQDFSERMFGSRYQTQVQDLIKAGLNPMLAYAQSPGSGPQGMQPQMKSPEVVSAMNETKLTSAQAAKITQETNNLYWEQRQIQQMTAKIGIEGAKISKEIDKIQQDIDTGKASQHQLESLKLLYDKQRELYGWEVELAKQTRNIKRPEEIASASEGALVGAHVGRWIRPVVDVLDRILRR